MQRFENVARELPIMRALVDNHEVLDFAKSLPDFRELRAQQVPKQRADAYVGEIITFPSNSAAARRIVSVLGMVQRLLHEPGEGLRPVCTDGLASQFSQRRIQSENVQRPTPNVQ